MCGRKVCVSSTRPKTSSIQSQSQVIALRARRSYANAERILRYARVELGKRSPLASSLSLSLTINFDR
jgi:hypothetical protein